MGRGRGEVLQTYNFRFPDGQTLTFEGEFITGLKAFLGSQDLAVYQTAEGGFVVVLSLELEPRVHFRYDLAEDVVHFLIGAMGQLSEVLLGYGPERLEDGEMAEYLKKL